MDLNHSLKEGTFVYVARKITCFSKSPDRLELTKSWDSSRYKGVKGGHNWPQKLTCIIDPNYKALFKALL